MRVVNMKVVSSLLFKTAPQLNCYLSAKVGGARKVLLSVNIERRSVSC